ncbi:hypothetical protein IGI04_025750 [Brassica rapa subsp. trilocularis]|uniref:Uncharacterized protein n=1 Tax=Brassica rapa subsp. trilocularis TaxID=1813537 RepID=A0ABQ7KXW9_BRACM|nr:hypothetical protein IGI04_025750 [Brassica rapa subsp. trilocularis]
MKFKVSLFFGTEATFDLRLIREGKRLNHKPKTKYRFTHSRHLFISTHTLHQSLRLTSFSIHLHLLLHP